MYRRSRHIHIKYHFVRDHCEAGHVILAYISTNENIADIMTKCLTKQTHWYLSSKLLHGLSNGTLFNFDGTPLLGIAPKPSADILKSQPDLSRYKTFVKRDISDFDSESEIRATEPSLNKHASKILTRSTTRRKFPSFRSSSLPGVAASTIAKFIRLKPIQRRAVRSKFGSLSAKITAFIVQEYRKFKCLIT